MKFARDIVRAREFILFCIIIAGGAATALAEPVFASAANIQALLLGLSVEAIVACGMTVLLVSGGFDLSVGSVLAFAGIATSLALKAGMPVWAGIAGGLASGAGIGLVNGVVIARLGINPFITTLGMMSMVRGLVLVASGGRGVSGLPEGFTVLAQGSLFGVQSLIWIMAAIVAVSDFFLRHSRFFRQNYYIGGNEKAARLSGIHVEKVKIINYLLSGLLAAAAGILFTARLGNASVTAGAGLELRVISAVIIGGASLSGGEGTVRGAFLGALLLAVITNALNIFGVDVYWQSTVIGATLLAAVIIDSISRKNRTA